jgi:hypothetical protein
LSFVLKGGQKGDSNFSLDPPTSRGDLSLTFLVAQHRRSLMFCGRMRCTYFWTIRIELWPKMAANVARSIPAWATRVANVCRQS